MTTTLAMISATQKKGPLGSKPNRSAPSSPLHSHFRRGSASAGNPSPSGKTWWQSRQIWGTWWVSGEGTGKSIGILRKPPSVSLPKTKKMSSSWASFVALVKLSWMGELLQNVKQTSKLMTSNSWVRTGDDVILTADREIFVFDRIKVWQMMKFSSSELTDDINRKSSM